MSNRLLNSAWAIKGIGAAEKLVLINLADRADSDGKCFPGHEKIAGDCNLSERSIRNILPHLEKAGHITVKRESFRGYKGQSVFSYLVHPTPANGATVTPEAVSAVEASDTGKPFPRHRKLTTATPANGANSIYITPIEPLINPNGKTLIFPTHLRTPQFQTKWSEWETYRKGLKKVKNLHLAFQKHLNILANHTEADAGQMIDNSIASSWRSLFPIKKFQQSKFKSSVPRPAANEKF